jgi:hypothetical protein
MIKKMLAIMVVWGLVWLIQTGCPEEQLEEMALVGQREITTCE